MFIFVGGIPGVGKTSIIKGLVQKLNNSGNKAEVLDGLAVLCKLAGNVSPEEFRKLPGSIREKYRPEMLQIIYEKDKKDFSTMRVVDGHFAYFEAGKRGFSIKNINSEDYEHIKAIFVIESDPETILERRKKDFGERIDRVLDIDYIGQQLEIEKNEAITQAKKLNTPIFFIDNNKNLNEAIKEIYIKTTEIFKLSSENNEIKLHKGIKFF